MNETESNGAPRRILLVIGGGVAAYKCLELIRMLAKRGIATRAILTRAGAEFVTPLSVGSLTGDKVYTDLFSLTDEAEMGHIELSRAADLVVVAPATADLLAKAACGLAGDLASTALLATDKPVLFAPAMNVRMWTHPATQRNLATLRADGASFVGPDVGEMACGEFGPGRMAEPCAIAVAIEARLATLAQAADRPLAGRRALVTAGPTHEPIDPVRYIANRSSGKQGYAIAGALADAGADVVLVSGPTTIAPPVGVTVRSVETAAQMLEACKAALPVDIAVMCAAVADYRPDVAADRKIKKERGGLDRLPLAENPDILKTLSEPGPKRPHLVIGFAAETDDVLAHARAKRARKGCDWIVANDVSGGAQSVMGADSNAATLITPTGETAWPLMSKTAIAEKLTAAVVDAFKGCAPARAAE